jgi:phenylacetate-CoA ligase
MWPIGRKGDEVVVDGKAVLPVDVWDAVESVDACALGLFQIVRPAREVDQLQLRVGVGPAWRDKLPAVGDDVRAAVHAAVGLVPDVELVPDHELLRLGPPHKIPRVAAR